MLIYNNLDECKTTDISLLDTNTLETKSQERKDKNRKKLNWCKENELPPAFNIWEFVFILVGRYLFEVRIMSYSNLEYQIW